MQPEGGDTGGETLFASYNIHKCVGTDGRFDPDRIAAVIAEIAPDVIALQEADRRFGDRAGLLDLRRIEADTGLVAVPGINGHVRSHGWHGNLVLVREGLVRDLRQLRLPGLEPRGAVVVDLGLRDGHVRLMAAHLGLLRQSRLLQIETLLAHAGHTGERPVVVMGDMNEWRRMDRSALRQFDTGFGPLGQPVPSFPSYFPMLPLDRIIARPARILGRLQAHDTPLARVASDHLPVKAPVRLAAASLAASAAAEPPQVSP